MMTGKWRYHTTTLAIAVSMFLVVVLLDQAFPPPLNRANDVSHVVVDRNGHWIHGFTNQSGHWRFSADLDQIDPTFISRLIAIEDKRFWDHQGVDAIAIIRALRSAMLNGRIVSGASTITMQTARLLEPRPRTLLSKTIEMIRALQIERRLTKREILELYLTLAPYGGNIQGVRAASLIWFDREPSWLTPAEQALLIALPQAPEARRPDRRPQAARNARNSILKRLAEQDKSHAMSAARTLLLVEAMQVPVPLKRHRFPQSAWHFAYEHYQQRNTKSALGEINTTLDLTIQSTLEREILNTIQHYQTDSQALNRSRNQQPLAAAIVIDNQSREVLALIGAHNRQLNGGWIDMTKAQRSPGSALKPFIYGLALEDGLIGPNTVIDDMPRGFDGYSPENFDRTFRGQVRIKEALQHSLNVPAVSTLQQVGSVRFTDILTMAGANVHYAGEGKRAPGLAMALGGAGITMRDVATLYTALADNGKVRPLITKLDKSKNEKKQEFRLFSADTATIITQILQGSPSLRGRIPDQLTSQGPKVAFKTGTSYGFRDAWAAGYNHHYTIVVWVGHADGTPRPGKTGRNSAAPLLMRLFDRLQDVAIPVDRQARPLNIDENIAASEGLNNSLMANQHDFPATTSALALRRNLPPEIVFPPDGGELLMPATIHHAFNVAARGGHGSLTWYVDGKRLDGSDAEIASTTEQILWYPSVPGFYKITVIDEIGQQTDSLVRIHAKL